jgi:hypothetical protein
MQPFNSNAFHRFTLPIDLKFLLARVNWISTA